jgi:predicted nucleotidyltransferase
MNESSAIRSNTAPVVFLSYASEDRPVASRIATSLFDAGIEVFFDDWEMRAGDSIRERIDAGLGRCTHFIVLLTPHSIGKAWVRAEMDAAFVRRVEGECRFIPLRQGLPAADLPPLLRGLLSPQIDDFEADIRRLIEDIREVDRKPRPLPTAPASTVPASEMGLSPAAAEIVELLVRRSKHGLKFDPQLRADEVQKALGLSDDAIRDAVEELIELGVVEDSKEIAKRPLGFLLLFPQELLFALYDRFFMEWNPADDALRIAADLVNEGKIDEQIEPLELQKRYGWQPRRLNPAMTQLSLLGAAKLLLAIGTAPYCCALFWLTSKARRFVRAHEREDSILSLVRSKRSEILEIAQRNQAFNPRIFGSSLRGDRRSESDIDLLVSLQPQASLLDIGRIKEELEELLKAPVDVVDEGSLHRAIRDRILAEAQPI